MVTAYHRSTKYHRKESDNRLFPFQYGNAWCMWNRLTNKAGYIERDRKTNRRKIHPHSLRKFFKSRMQIAKIPIEIVEKLMGHEEGTRSVYSRNVPQEELAEWYNAGEVSSS